MQLIMGLPESIITTGGGEAGQEVEYLLYTKLFGLWDQFSIVEKMIATDPRNLLEQDGQGHWKRRLEVCAIVVLQNMAQRYLCRAAWTSYSRVLSALCLPAGV